MDEFEKELIYNRRRTKNIEEFKIMCELFPERVNIVAEGDSWFAYPPEWFISTKPSNIIRHLSSMTQKKANFLSLASNGDEAVDMLSGKQKHTLIKILRLYENSDEIEPVNILLFSGGGNDLVGDDDFERFIVGDATGIENAQDCIEMDKLDRKTTEIALAYEELLDIRDYYTPDTVIITHTYDYPYPSNVGAIFLGGLIKTKAWVKRFMDKANIDEHLQADVIKIFMD